MNLFNLFVLVFISLTFNSEANYISSFDSLKMEQIILRLEHLWWKKCIWGLIEDNPKEVDLSE